MKTKLVFLLFLSIIILEVNAQWPAIPSPNVPIYIHPVANTDVKDYWSSTDGFGGSYAVWSDERNDPGNTSAIYVQRINKRGVVKILGNGVLVSNATDPSTGNQVKQKRPKITNDGSTGGIMVWEDERNVTTTSDDIYVEKVDSNMTLKWGGIGGIAACDTTGKQEKPWIVSDGSGGAIIAWEDERDKNTDLGAGKLKKDIYAQRISASGAILWRSQGVVICNAVDDQKKIHMIADGSGGAIIVWEDKRNGTTDIYGQKISTSGVVQWGANGIAICTENTDNQKRPQVTTDMAGGGIVAWEDKRNGGIEDIYAEYITLSGAKPWGVANGKVICNATDKQKRPVAVSDGFGGAVISWEDKRTGGIEDIYVAKIINAGTLPWPLNGNAVCTAADVQKRAHMTTATGGNVLITWEDKRTGTNDIYVEVVGPTGAMTGGTINGIQVTNAGNKQGNPFVFNNGNGEWIVVWEDERNAAGEKDLYAQGLNSTIIVALPIELISFNAIPNGNIVELDWSTATEINNDYFTIERSHNGIDWEQVITVSGAGNSSSIVEYFDTDSEPLLGLSYYRLVQTDFDGKSSTSNIVPVEFISDGNETNISVFPNPARLNDNINIDLAGFKDTEVLVVLRDIQGKEVYSKVSLIENNNQIIAVDKTHTLSSGTYLVLASAKNELYSKKLIITE